MYKYPIISIEGIDGAGKSTQTAALIDSLSKTYGEVIHTKYPGATPLGMHIRQALIGTAEQPAFDIPDEGVRQYLFAADLRMTTRSIILPQVHEGKLVILDRFLASNFTYSHFGCQLEADESFYFLEGVLPEEEYSKLWFCNILLDMPVERVQERETKRDYGDSFPAEYYERIRQGYLKLAGINPQLWHIIDATLPKEQVTQHVFNAITNFIDRVPKNIQEGKWEAVFNAL